MSSLVGNLLNIKPIVHVQDGVYVPIGKVRSMKQAVIGMVDFLANRSSEQTRCGVGVGHGQSYRFRQDDSRAGSVTVERC